MSWKLVPAENISELVRDGLMGVVLDANRPDDADDTGALIRTLRPNSKVSLRAAQIKSISRAYANQMHTSIMQKKKSLP